MHFYGSYNGIPLRFRTQNILHCLAGVILFLQTKEKCFKRKTYFFVPSLFLLYQLCNYYTDRNGSNWISFGYITRKAYRKIMGGTCHFTPPKGQIILECPYEIIVYPKIATKKFPRFLPWPLRRGQIKKIKALYYTN